MAAWSWYASASAFLLLVLVAGVAWLVPAAEWSGLWLAALVAFAVQVAAFAALVWSRRRGRGFMVSWGLGMLLRFVVVGVVAFWVTQGTSLDPAVTLVSLVGFVFVLVLLEPLFLRLAD